MAEDDARELETEPERVILWRASRLVDLGCGPAAALELAERAELDVHEFERLIQSGATVDQAIAILG